FLVLTAWPATDLGQASSLAIEGQPSEMFVENGKAVVYSSVNGGPLYQAAGVKPRAAYSEGGGGVAYADAPTTAAPSPRGAPVDPTAPNGGGYTGPYVPLTK